MWANLGEEIAEQFAAFEGCIDPGVDFLGFHRHEHLTLTRATIDGSRPGMTPEQKAARRRVLEQSRREYKARKAREYYARDKAA